MEREPAIRRLTIRNLLSFGEKETIYVELPLCWDNEDEPVGVRTAETIISEIKEDREGRGEKNYKFISVQSRN